MPKTRLEAFTDAVIAIVMTILVLELAAPDEPTFQALWNLRYKIIIYILSFVSLAIYWNNHHHLFQLTTKTNGKILWLNMFFLLFLFLFPFTTAWVDEHLTELAPQITYGVVMLGADIMYALLSRALVKAHGKDSQLAGVFAGYKKQGITLGVVAAGIIAGIFVPPAVVVCCAASLVLWVVPEKRIEKTFG